MESETYRLFFALWPDAVTRAAIHRATHAVVRHAGGRPVRAENYHLTLAFLGEQPAALLPSIIEAGASLAARTGELRLLRLGYFERTRVLWLGPENTPNPLRLHVRRLWQALAPLGIARERRPFAAHLTLARKVNRAPVVAVRPVSWRYVGFALVESVTQSQGARYRLIAKWPPAAGAGVERME
ncbi:MAG: RNA 2',3'-cyclic phosphodiesterase [Gammaproteobacteria bacterium]